MTELVCSCGVPIPPKQPGKPGLQARWCSRPCWQKDADTRRKMRRDEALAARKCPTCDGSVPLDLPAHALYCSGLCKRLARRKEPEQVTCACGVIFTSNRQGAKHCSTACQRRAGRDHPSKICASTDCDKPVRAKGLCNYCYRKDRGERRAWTDARRDSYHRRRALKAETSTGRPVLLSDISERDGNRCHLCRKAVPDKVWPHPLSPSLDHVIPLSRGGIHDPDNVKLAHLRCNVEKGAGGGNEQLLLIG